MTMTTTEPTPSQGQDSIGLEIPAFGIDHCRRLKAFEESNKDLFNRLVEAISDERTRPILRALVDRDSATVAELTEHTAMSEAWTAEETRSLEWAELVATTDENPPVVRLAPDVTDETIVAMLSLRNRLEAIESHT